VKQSSIVPLSSCVAESNFVQKKWPLPQVRSFCITCTRFPDASHANFRLVFTSCTAGCLCQTATSSVHHAAALDIRGTPFIWLSTLHINMPSLDHQCHVMPSGLKKYGWEAHDGKSYGRQELYDEHFHLTTSWVSVCVAYLTTTTHC